MEKLFVYGTLRIPEVQQRVFGRETSGTPDRLPGYRVVFKDFATGSYPMAIPDEAYAVEGEVLEVNDTELRLIDIYETSAYARIRVMLDSGTEAWVYTAP
ncbi:MAG: hypothetical protein OHK0046_29640 [Anaerolineae bacterium]